MATSEKLDSRFKFGPPPIQTAEDATMAYLREEITEDEYREALGKYGILPGQIMKVSGERVDAAFKNSIPDDIYDPKPETEDNLENRLKAVDDAEKDREKAAKEAEKQEGKVQLTREVPAPLADPKDSKK